MLAKRLWADFYRLALNAPRKQVEQPVITAAIPLISKAKSGDWNTVCLNLARTVQSVLDQRYDNIEVLICGQDEPHHVPQSDKVRFLKAPAFSTKKKSDKGHKISLMADDIAERYHRLTYLLILDADDLVHPDLFPYVATDNNSLGYLIDKGYLADFEEKQIAPLTPASGHPFDRHCGSCAVFALDLTRPWVAKSYIKTLSRGHNQYGRMSKRFGVPLVPVPFPAALYVINHGENARARRGTGGFKSELLRKNAVSDSEETRTIMAEYKVTF